MLIVTADDLGIDERTSAAIVEAYARGQITCAGFMVHMAGSAAAAQGVRATGLPIGLHVNLTEPFTASEVPTAVRSEQEAIVARFRGHLRRRRWTYSRELQPRVDAVIGAQIAEFVRHFGRTPAHVDGHHHVHACPNVLLSPALGELRTMRRVVFDGQQRFALAAPRQRLVVRRFASTDHLLAIQAIDAAQLRADTTTEVMTHPGEDDDTRILNSGGWRSLLSRHRLGSFEDL